MHSPAWLCPFFYFRCAPLSHETQPLLREPYASQRRGTGYDCCIVCWEQHRRCTAANQHLLIFLCQLFRFFLIVVLYLQGKPLLWPVGSGKVGLVKRKQLSL